MANRLDYGRIEALLNKPFDPVFTFLLHAPYMIEDARAEGRVDAHSYRGFQVAGGAYGINPAEKTAWEDSAGNLKRESKNKICTERKLYTRAAKQGVTTMIGLVVLGTTDRELIREVSGLPTPTLHLCSDCRHDVPASPIVSASMLIIHSGLDSDVNQTFTIGQEVDMYARAEKGDVDPALFRHQTDFTDWEQRLQTYMTLTGGAEALSIPLEERQRLAQLALNKEVSIF